MKQEDTKQKILDKALELFSEYGYDSVSVGQIAQAVGIKAPSLYNHFPGKQAIFDAIVESTAARYAEGTDRLSVHVQDARRDVPEFSQITAGAGACAAVFPPIRRAAGRLSRGHIPQPHCRRGDTLRRSRGAGNDVCCAGNNAYRHMRPRARARGGVP